MEKHIIDATSKKLGRVASQAASLIMGKHLATFKRNEIPDVVVTIENASKADITVKKLTEKEYQRYSGYPGGLKILSAAQTVAKKGYAELFRKAVFGMLPTNRLRAKMIKRLTVTE